MRHVPEVEFSATTGKAMLPFLRRHVAASMPLLRPGLLSVSVALVGERKMDQLHRQFMNIAGATDVLTFELDHDDHGRVSLGQIVVCIPIATLNARRLGHPARHEALLYVIHGLLHLTGHDDRDEATFRRMHDREDQILSTLGIGSVFASRASFAKRSR
jgi:probable rRNA maturation factor